jgi:peptidoglycan/LPS O-acetylase OafA/YrhL
MPQHTTATSGHDRNNLDFLRLLFALAVIFSHSYPLVTAIPDDEPLWRLTHHHDTLGGLAVVFFFFVSGFLITGSYISSPNLGRYLRKRSLRIFPGYLACAAVSILVVAPLAAVHADPHLFAKLTLQTVIMEPLSAGQLFISNPWPSDLNGPIWTIRYEFCCYLLIPLLAFVGLLRRPMAIFWMLPILFLLSFAPRIFPGLNQRHLLIGQWGPWCRFVREFLLGSLFFLWRQKIRITPAVVAVAVVCVVGSSYVKPTELGNLILETATACIVYYVAFADWIPLHHFGKYGDFSYGTYLYGWPVQQMLIRHFGAHLSPLGLFFTAAPLSVGLAILSWHLV